MPNHLHTYPPLTLQQGIWQVAHQLRLPVAFWRLPQSATVHTVIDLSGEPLRTLIDLDALPTGFAFSPFLNPAGDQTLFLRAHLHYTFRDESWREEEMVLPSGLEAQREQFRGALLQRVKHPLPARAVSVSPTAWRVSTANEKPAFEKLVQRGTEAIRRGNFQKVVLSRQKHIALPEPVDLVETYHHLCRNYPDAFVSLVSVPGRGTWMGASPEILVSVDKAAIFRTVALAGTQPLLPDVPPLQASWTQKEIEEQALVSRYIINCFKQIRLREFEEDGPKTVAAGNLLHLRTDFSVDTRAVHLPRLGTVMLRLLHPTSAVCGMPKADALRFILENEGYERAFYSGFLGPVHVAGESHLFVSLRCTQWLAEGVILYAGAGITANSVPEKEWRETELKCGTMLRVLTSQT